MKRILLLTAVVIGVVYAVRSLLGGDRREQIAHLPMTMMERCMEMMPDDAPPKALMSGVDPRALVLTQESAARIVRKEQAAIRRAVKRFDGDNAGFQEWLDDFYVKHAQFIVEVLHVENGAALEYTENQLASIMEHGVEVVESWLGLSIPVLVDMALGEGNGTDI